MHALVQSKMQMSAARLGNIRVSYKLDKLTPDDILYQIYCLSEWFLYLTKDEHLEKTTKVSCRETG